MDSRPQVPTGLFWKAPAMTAEELWDYRTNTLRMTKGDAARYFGFTLTDWTEMEEGRRPITFRDALAFAYVAIFGDRNPWEHRREFLRGSHD